MKKKIKITSKKERKLWISALVVLTAIYTSLFLGGQFIDLMIERRIIEQSTFYLFILLILTYIVSGWKSSGKRLEYWIVGGMGAVLVILLSDIVN